MKTLEIEYTRLFFFRKRVSIQVPEKWSDLKSRQFSACAGIYLQPMSDVDFCSKFFGISKKVLNKLSKFELFKLTELTEFAVNPNGSVNFFFMYQIPGTRLQSPRPRLSDITIEHFAIFDTYFFEYVNKKTDEALDQFVAALYLKPNEVITGVDMNQRIASVASRVDQATKYAIFMNYIFLRRWLSGSFKFLFSSDEQSDEKESKRRKQPSKSLSNLPDWTGMIDDLIGDDIINADKYHNTKCLIAFKTINTRIKNYKKNGKPTR